MSRVAEGRGEGGWAEALQLFRAAGDRAGEVEAPFWLGLVHHVVRGDSQAAAPFLRESYAFLRRIEAAAAEHGP